VPLTLAGAPAKVGGIGVLGDRSRDLDILLYNHATPSGTAGVPATPAQPATINVAVPGLRPGRRSAGVIRIDADHANPRAAWEELGSSEYPTRRQLARISDASELREERLPLDYDRRTGNVTFTLTLPAEGVAAVNVAQ
jgi:xylan 1,4-beta-xylosidase